MAIEIEKSRGKNNGPVFVVLTIFLVVVFLVFLSLKKNLGIKISKTDIRKIINKDTVELKNINKNLDKNIDDIFQREDFRQLYKHNDVSNEFEIGKTDPFKSF